MDTLTLLLHGFATAMTWEALFFCFVGVTIGMLIGVLPGIGPLATISMLLPLTYYLEPSTALIMLAGIYYGSQYGGSTASILLNLPGEAGAAVTCLDGYPMSRKGRAGVALFVTTIGSFVGGCTAIIVMALLAPPLGKVAVMLGSAEYFAVMLLGLIAAVTLIGKSVLKGLVMIVLGLLLGLMGTDVISGQIRFAFGTPYLYDGLDLALVAMGLFGVSEILASIGSPASNWLSQQKITLRSLLPTREDVRRSVAPTVRGSLIGSIIGVLPGAGTTVAAFMAYAAEKRVSRYKDQLGTGIVEGVASPESANNAAAQTNFIPTLTLGVPGGATMALMLGALLIHGIVPGPTLITNHPDIFWGLIASFWIGNLMLLILNLPMIGLWVRILKIPYSILYPGILVFIALGVYTLNYSFVDVIMVGVLGIVGYGMNLLRFEPAPLLLGYILGPMMEANLRRSLLISGGDVSIFWTRPLSATLMLLCIALILYPIVMSLLGRTRVQAALEE
ncbi:MAG TPA: tripartite tricarboxylate transporter permease [Rhizobiaceae bacterium]|nr:tripartite tricarboxylate transporter permease [Rhizobiaceae bacterium]